MKTRGINRLVVIVPNRFLFVGVLVVVVAILTAPAVIRSHAANAPASKTLAVEQPVVTPDQSLFATSRSPFARLLALSAPPTPPSVSTFASDCVTSQDLFNPGDTVCAHVTGAQSGWQLIWSNAKFIAVQTNVITSATQDISFTLSQNASRGDWRVIVFDQIGGTVQAVTLFTVADVQNPLVDVQVQKVQKSDSASAGAQVVFNIQVQNAGPDSAINVQLTDQVPTNTTFVSFSQLTGPVFTCTSPNPGDVGATVCTVASFARNAVATFVGTYTADANVATGASIDNTASVSNDIADSNSSNDSATASVPVLSAPCVLTCPSNIVQDTDPGQAGAIVTYSAPTSTGDCGQPVIDPETGNTIPPITCSPASGSFFGVGTTPVICSADQAGTVCTFQVTINNPGGLTISLNGANPLSLECGDGFTDPGASAVDATGQAVPVTITPPQGFNADAPAVGSYTITYTATEGTNSVSTTRTVNVADTKPPAITINGSNPYKIQLGTCLPFVDPGVSATDGCIGKVPVSSSISGPGGLTHVDTSIAGTYTITYSASDGTHSTTATRSVLVGNFPPDEQDLGSSNGTPVIKLNGGDPDTGAITVECGFFVDPGATATDPCGVPLPYTVTGTVANAPGTYILTYTVTDNNVSASVQRAVTITADNTPPTITLNGANPLTVECHGTFSDPGATAHDACAGNFAATASGSVDVNTVGTYVITYNATDPTGHAATPVTRTVNVVDTTPPVVTAPTNVTLSTGANATTCSTVVSDAQLGTATANDLCQGSLQVTRTGVPAGNVFPVGQTIITYSATDASGNTSTATQQVTVVDNTPPVISCPVSITLEPTCPSGAKATYITPVGTDNCGGATTSRTAGLESGSVFPIGTTTVTYTVVDAAGNTASCSFQVTVKTPQQTVLDMMAAVQALQPPLTGTQVQGLNSKLQAALDAVNQGKTNIACNKLSDVISQVTAYINNGTLTSAQGTPLITSANHVRNTIGCTNQPCT
jgi:uncharacterized repeat protein (TIGR01451 family)